MTAPKIQNEVAQNYLKGSDLAEREQQVLAAASRKTSFIPHKLIRRSAWWGSSEIGAFHYLGEFKGKKAVIKIQGIKPSISEIYMINSFARNNSSKIIRPPHLYATVPWDDQNRYEALVIEFIKGPTFVKSPTTQAQITRFFDLYQEYRIHCLNSPWVGKPQASISQTITENFAKWREMSFKIYPTHPLREEQDQQLIDEALDLLKIGYSGIEPEFIHGHLSTRDLYAVADQVVVLSNLFWSWRQPLYDAIFGYHWFIYQLNDVVGITPVEVEEQRALWLDEIRALPQAQGNNNQRLLNLALLERAIAGLNLDALSADPNKPITKYLFETTRKQIRELIDLLR